MRNLNTSLWCRVFDFCYGLMHHSAARQLYPSCTCKSSQAITVSIVSCFHHGMQQLTAQSKVPASSLSGEPATVRCDLLGAAHQQSRQLLFDGRIIGFLASSSLQQCTHDLVLTQVGILQWCCPPPACNTINSCCFPDTHVAQHTKSATTGLDVATASQHASSACPSKQIRHVLIAAASNSASIMARSLPGACLCLVLSSHAKVEE